jgi:hypothetical protein
MANAFETIRYPRQTNTTSLLKVELLDLALDSISSQSLTQVCRRYLTIIIMISEFNL